MYFPGSVFFKVHVYSNICAKFALFLARFVHDSSLCALVG